MKMEEKKIITGVIVNENTAISFTFMEICTKCKLTEETLVEMVEHGLSPQEKKPVKQRYFDYKTLVRIQSAARLQNDLGINIPGAALVLELLDELEAMRNELSILRHHVTLADKT